MNPLDTRIWRVWSVVVPGAVLLRPGFFWLDNLVCDEVLGVCLQEREGERDRDIK